MSDPSVRDLFILGRVSQGPTYGHEIMADIRVSRADLWVELSEKHVYYVLKKLEREGLVASADGRGDGGPRLVYEITPPGRDALAAWLELERFAESVAYSDFDTVVAILGCADGLDDRAKTAVLRRRLAELDRRLSDEYTPLMGRHIEGRFGATARALYDKGRTLTQAERAWLSDLILEVERDGWGAFGLAAGGDQGPPPCEPA